jgi:hypothetical protein
MYGWMSMDGTLVANIAGMIKRSDWLSYASSMTMGPST